MNNEFQEKLQLYKDGKLSQNEASEIECEIDKFSAITDYLSDDDKAFLEELKQQMPDGNTEENKPVNLLKRRVNFKIIKMTTISVLSISIIIISLFFLTSKIVTSLFNLNYKEAYVERSKIVQLAQMFHPQYESNSGTVDQSLFTPQQNITVYLDNTVGNTIIDKTQIIVRYSFGKPVWLVRSETSVVPPLLEMDNFPLIVTEDSPSHLIDGVKSNYTSDFKPLEKAPEGTKAKIFVVFKKALTPGQLKENIISQINTKDAAPLKFTPLAAIKSHFILANPSYYQFTPVYPYDNDDYAKQSKNRVLKQNQFDDMDDNAHKESFISNLNLIKNNKKLVQIMYYEDMFDYINIDNIIKDVENNGVKYIGMYISADSKELLKLKDNSTIDHIRVENIVVW